jgi:hypothetical protein
MLVLLSTVISLIFWQNPKMSWIAGDGFNRWMSMLTINGREWQTIAPSISINKTFVNPALLVWCFLWGAMSLMIYRQISKDCGKRLFRRF